MSKNAAWRRFRARQHGATMLPQVRHLAVIGAILAAGMGGTPANADAPAGPLPSGATVAAGGVHIDAGASSVTVNQSSARAVINWAGFSIGAGNTVVFNQPDAQSATLNRVSGSASSTIAGQITSNGAVYLVNPNGIAITTSGAIDTRGGFVASTLDIADGDFMAGNLAFAGSGSSASVTNAGTIRAGESAFVALLGGSVSNSGTITVPLGKVGLGSGERIALDLNGGNFLQVAVPTSLIGDAALIDDAGTISASGGSVVLSTATVKSAVRNVINMSGAINADSAITDGGVIRLLGGEGGTVTASGTLSARATGAAGSGGTVETSGAVVDFGGLSVDTRATDGRNGLWLIDPTDLNVDQTAANTISANLQTSNVELDTFGDGSTAGPGTPTPGAGDININGVINWNSNNNLTLNAFNDVNFNAALHWTGSQPGIGGGIFNVNAGHNINVSAPIDWNQGFGLFFNAALDISINAALTSNTNMFASLYADRNADGHGTVTFGRAGSVSTNGAVVNLFYNPAGGDYTNPTDYSAAIPLFNAGGSGTGSALFPYMLVNTLTDLQSINTNVAGIYALNADIDASATAGWNGGAGFLPLGLDSSGGIIGNGFVGQLNGQGHTIDGLTINRPNNDDVGLFGYFNGVLGSLALTNVAITGRSSVGGAIGYLDTFVNNVCLFCGPNNAGSVSVSGTISGVNNVGGLVGFSNADINGGSVGNATITGRVAPDGSGGNGVGGILGTQMAGTVKDTVTTNSVSVLGAPNVGGVVGAFGGGTIQNVQSLATVTGTNGTGGVVGSAFGGAIDASTAAAVVNGAGNAGGFVGVIAGPVTINSSAANSVVNGTGLGVGGFVGAMNGGGTITNSAASGSVSGYAFVGGFAGAINLDTFTGISGTITGSTVNGSTVSGTSTDPAVDNPVGGFVGYAGGAQLSSDTVNATTTVNGFNDVGGFIGLANQSSVLSQLSSSATVTATNNNVGGLAGALIDGSTLDGGTATGRVSSPNGVTIGGLVGYLTGTVNHSTATGAVTGSGFVGGLVGNINGGGQVTNSVAAGVVTGSDPVNSDKIGGLVGHSQNGTIRDSLTSASSRVSGGTNIGGIVGQAESATTVSGVASNSIVTGQGSVGGIAGQLLSGSTIDGSVANGSVTGSGIDAGGLVGYLAGGAVNNSVAYAAVTGFAYVGGLVGNINGGTVSNSSTGGSATVTGSDPENSYWIGGLVGNASAATIVDSSASGAVSGNAQIGGLVGYLNTDSSIARSGATGSVTGTGSVHANFDVGGLVGFSAGSISQSTASGAVRGFLYVGGLVGWLDDAGSIFGSRADGTVTGVAVPGATGLATTGTANGRPFQFDHTYDIGGLVGLVRGSLDGGDQSGSVSADAGSENVGGLAGEAAHLITRSQSRAASVIGGTSVGGLVGTVDNVTIDGSTARSTVSGNTNVGGLVGTSDGTISNSSASGAVSGSNSVGGLLGSGTNGSLVTKSFATGNVALGAGTGAGGLVGYDYGAITLSYATGNVLGGSGSNSLGGLVGVLNGSQSVGTVSDAYATGAVTGQNIVGGLVGGNTGSINRTYAVGDVSGSTQVGGLVGWNLGSTSSVTNSYWDTTSTAQTSGFGQNDGTFVGAGRTTAQMQDLNTFQANYGGFDFFNVWAPPNRSGQGGDATAHYPDLYALSLVAWVHPDDASRVYGNANPAFTFGVSGLRNGDGLAAAPRLSSIANAASNVGSYVINQSGAQPSGAYRLVLSSGTLSVTPRALTLTPDALSRLYGGANPTTDTATAAAATANSGLVNGDSVASISVTSPATSTSGVGQYALNGSNAVFGQGLASNYTIAYNPNAIGLTITPAQLSTIVTASLVGSASKTYDGTRIATLNPANFLLAGFVNGEGAAVSQTSGTYASANAGRGILVTASLSPGDFQGNSGTNLSNYILPVSASGTIGTILPAPLTIAYIAYPARRAYGESNALLAGTTIASGLVGPDSLASVTSGRAVFTTIASRTSNVGAYAITGSGLIGSSGNYAYSFVQAGGNLSALRVTPASLIVYFIANPVTTRSGQAVGSLTGSQLAVGLVNGDTLGSVTSGTAGFTTNATASSGAGNYAITGSGLVGVSANYAIRFLQSPLNSFAYSVLSPLRLRP